MLLGLALCSVCLLVVLAHAVICLLVAGARCLIAAGDRCLIVITCLFLVLLARAVVSAAGACSLCALLAYCWCSRCFLTCFDFK